MGYNNPPMEKSDKTKTGEILNRAGVIDIGSSSIKLIIGEAEGADIRILEHLKNPVPIGRYTFYKGIIPQESINQILEILAKYKEVLAAYDVPKVVLFATTAVREARNRDIFLDTLLRKTGFRAEVFTAGDVVYYIDSYIHHKLKDTYPIHEKNLLIAELGAGSLDVSVMEKGFTLFHMGLALGTLRVRQLMAKLSGSAAETVDAVGEYIENEFLYLKHVFPDIDLDDVILIDETFGPYLGRLTERAGREEKFFKLQIDEAKKALALVVDKSPQEIEREYKIPVETAENITGYLIILNNFFGLLKSRYIYILETSLAEAVLANDLLGIELAKRYNKTNQLISAAKFICKRYSVDLAHSKHVTELARTIFDNLKGQLGLLDDDALYLLLAGYLHDIGSFVHNRSHHKHSEYIIGYLNLFRLSEQEIRMIACIARYHRKAPPMASHLLYNSLDRDKKIIVQKLSAILRVANALDSSHRQKIKKLEIKYGKNQEVILVAHTAKSIALEEADFADKKDFFEEVTGSKMLLKVSPD